ncbi:uncharacterized protein METZ01_LOCUS121403 [marine metagenome]|uniref:Uncharacterized protein n=1 Tax=marine metagenome TaxID=408172 RepID=A0A381XUU7_9ZZZZ
MQESDHPTPALSTDSDHETIVAIRQ